jgi:hypothetical protein
MSSLAEEDDAKVVLIMMGIYLFVNKARGGGSLKFLFLLCDVTTMRD